MRPVVDKEEQETKNVEVRKSLESTEYSDMNARDESAQPVFVFCFWVGTANDKQLTQLAVPHGA